MEQRTAVLVLLICIQFVGCGRDIEDSTTPDPPIWVEKSGAIIWPETGIDANEGAGIELSWYSISNDIVAYNLYTEEVDKDREFSGKPTSQMIVISNQAVQYFVNEDVEHWKYYAFWLTAQDNAENNSGPSDTIFYSVIPSVVFDTMSPNSESVASAQIDFSWDQGYYVEMLLEDYVITILDENNQLVIRDRFLPSNYTGDLETWVLPDSIILQPGTYWWRIDVGAGYSDECESIGGETPWANFSISR